MNPISGALAPPPAGQWDAAALGLVREINEQAVELLCEAAARGSAGALPTLVRQDFLPAGREARRRLADCPYLLLDAGFADPERWLAAAASVRDRGVGRPSVPPGIDCGVPLARRALLLGWHLAHCNRLAARIALGMSAECAERIVRLRLEELEAIAEDPLGGVRLRWETRIELWRPLLRAARSERVADLAGLRMRGLQLLAADAGLAGH